MLPSLKTTAEVPLSKEVREEEKTENREENTVLMDSEKCVKEKGRN